MGGDTALHEAEHGPEIVPAALVHGSVVDSLMDEGISHGGQGKPGRPFSFPGPGKESEKEHKHTDNTGNGHIMIHPFDPLFGRGSPYCLKKE